MKNLNDILQQFDDIQDMPISEELLGAYIDGNTEKNDSELIEKAIKEDSMLSETFNAVRNNGSSNNGFDWELHKGDFGFWELGLPPIVTEEDIINAQIQNSMAGKKTYGYESNNEIDKFDPAIWQGNQPTCAIRSQEIILRDYGIFHSQDELIEFATKNGWFDPDPIKGGTDKYAVGNLLDACGIPTTRTDNATIYDIISELKAGHRVIVSVDADELWVKKEPNLFKRLIAQVNNKANDKIQDFLGLEGANHALVVAGVNVNPKDPSDIKVTLIDSGTGDVCIEYSFKDFHNAWNDGHCRMISTDIPAPFQYNYYTHQIEPSNVATSYAPSMIQMPDGLTNQFSLSDNYFETYKDLKPEYDVEANPIEVEGVVFHETASDLNSDTDDSAPKDNVQTGFIDEDALDQQTEGVIGNDVQEMEFQSDFNDDDNNDVSSEENYSTSSCESIDNEADDNANN